MRKTARKLPLSPYEKRLSNTNRKLQEALERLVKGLPTHPALLKHPYRLTVTTLAREARVGRNAIYANHREMIDALRRADQQRIVPDKLAAWEDKLAQQRSLIQVLQIDERRLVTENAVLLKRLLEAQAEATRQKRHADRLIAERDQTSSPSRWFLALPLTSKDAQKLKIQPETASRRKRQGSQSDPSNRTVDV